MSKVKRYLLWAGDHYYPCRGLTDYIGSFDTIDEAKAEGTKPYIAETLSFRQRAYDWYVVVDHETMEEVAYG